MIETRKDLDPLIADVVDEAVSGNVIILVYDDLFGESDNQAALSGKKDVERFDASRVGGQYTFGNFTYMNEWRIAARSGMLVRFKLFAIFPYGPGRYVVQSFDGDGRADQWTSEMEILDGQLYQLL